MGAESQMNLLESCKWVTPDTAKIFSGISKLCLAGKYGCTAYLFVLGYTFFIMYSEGNGYYSYHKRISILEGIWIYLCGKCYGAFFELRLRKEHIRA